MRKLSCRLFYIGLGAAVYHIWKLRNSTLHHETINTEGHLLQVIRRQVEPRLESRGCNPYTRVNEKLCKRWGGVCVNPEPEMLTPVLFVGICICFLALLVQCLFAVKLGFCYFEQMPLDTNTQLL